MTDRIHKPPEELLNLGQWFAVPNAYVDVLMKDLSASEFVVLMMIRRQTHGFRRTTARVSVARIEEVTGLSRPTVRAVMERLQKAGHIVLMTETDFWNAREWALNESYLLEEEAELEESQGTDEEGEEVGELLEELERSSIPSLPKPPMGNMMPEGEEALKRFWKKGGDIDALWADVLMYAQDRVPGRQQYTAYVQGLVLMGLDEGVATVRCRTGHIRAVVERHYLKILEECLDAVLDCKAGIKVYLTVAE